MLLGMSLAKLPSDIWAELNCYLSFFSIARLYLTGCRSLISSLTSGGILTAEIHWSADAQRLAWPNLIAHFPKLRKFVYDAGPEIETIILAADGAANAFSASRPLAVLANSDPPGCFDFEHDTNGPLDIAAIWPKLRTLHIEEYLGPLPDSQSFTNALTLPPSLTNFYQRSYLLHNKQLDSLPTGLVKLRLPAAALLATDVSVLPRDLECLQFFELIAENLSDLVGVFPPHLKSLKLNLANFPFEDFVRAIPRSIEKLDISVGNSFSSESELYVLEELPRLRVLKLLSRAQLTQPPAELGRRCPGLQFVHWDMRKWRRDLTTSAFTLCASKRAN